MPITIPPQPFTFASESGNQPAAQLDSSLANIRSALTGIALQATDLIGGRPLHGLIGNNNAGTPNSKYDLNADLVVLRNPTGGLNVQTTVAQTNDVSIAGPSSGGRDQAGAFGASSWIHFYFIWSGSTLSTVSSAVAPPTGPTLPSGFTHWAYAGAVFFTAGSILLKTRMRGSWMYFEILQNALSGGTATTETSVSLTNLIPPNALRWQGTVWNTGVTLSAGGAGDAVHALRYISGVTIVQLRSSVTAGNAGQAMYNLCTGFQIPNQAQNFFYLTVVTTGSGPSVSVDIQGYQVPNGGE